MKKILLSTTIVATLLSGQVIAVGGIASAADATPCVGCGPSSHVVQRGEWLWKIARADLAQRGIYSGNQAYVRARANAIYRANRALIGRNPNRIRPGMVLVLPDL